MIRLVDDFSRTATWVSIGGAVAFVAIRGLFGLVAFATAPVRAYDWRRIAGFMVVGGYAVFAFGRARRAARGHHPAPLRPSRSVPRSSSRPSCIAFVERADAEPLHGHSTGAIELAALRRGPLLLPGVRPPAWVRRAWREPDLPRFLERSIHLAAVPDDATALGELQTSAATAFGANGAAIGIADRAPARPALPRPGRCSGRSTRTTRSSAVVRSPPSAASSPLMPGRADPENADVYSEAGASTVIAAPITTTAGASAS